MATGSSPIERPDAARPAHQPPRPVQNVGEQERWGSMLVGGGLILAGIARGKATGLLMTLAGGSLLYRGARGHCGVYQLLGINTRDRNPAIGVPAQQGAKIEKSVTINKSPEEMYRFWRRLDNLPRVMRHLESVEVTDPRHSKWTALGPLGIRLQWKAEIVNEREGELVAWRSLPGGDVDTAGSVHFRRAPGDRGTVIQVNLKYDPPGGKIVASLAEFFGQGLQQQVGEDLRTLKQTLEAGEVPVAGEAVSHHTSK